MTSLNQLEVNGKRIKDWTIKDHNLALNNLAAPIYEPFDGVVVEGAGSKPYMLKVRIEVDNGEEQTEIIDGLSCYSAALFGHGDKIITKGVQDFTGKMATIPRSISHTYLGPWLAALKEYTGMEMFLPKNGGTEANESAIKAIRKWGRRHGGKNRDGIKNTPIIISAENSFHGRGYGSITLMKTLDDELSRKDIGPLLPGIKHVPFNNLNALENKLKEYDGQVAGVILEPIQAEAGVFIPDEDYLKNVQKLLKENNVLLALDEIQTGYGRTGADFAWQLYGLDTPDLMTIGKAMGAGVIPISCLCGRKDILSLFEPHSEGSTFGGYPLASYVGLLIITELQKRKITEMSAEKGAYLQLKLKEVAEKYPDKVKEVRGKGMLIGIEINPEYDGHDLSMNMLKNGVYAKETHSTNLRVSPPIVIDRTGMDKIVSAMDRSLDNLSKRV